MAMIWMIAGPMTTNPQSVSKTGPPSSEMSPSPVVPEIPLSRSGEVTTGIVGCQIDRGNQSAV